MLQPAPISKDQLISVARLTAAVYELAPPIVCAVCERESTWNPWKIRYEPDFFIKYVMPKNMKDDTEARARSISWGLMQVMGEVAREFSYTGELAALCAPEIGVKYGCMVLAHKYKVSGGNDHTALQTYNGGSNPNYADEVLAMAGQYK